MLRANGAAVAGKILPDKRAPYTGRPLARCPPRRVLFQRPPVRTRGLVSQHEALQRLHCGGRSRE